MGSLPRPTIEYNPQQNDPLSAIEKVTSLRSMLQGQQIQQQQIQAAQLENQQRQMAVRDQQVVRDAFVKNGGDPDKTLQDAARAGVSPATLQQLQLHAADLKTKNLALINAQGEKALRDADLMKGAYDTLVKTPPEQRPQVYPQLVNGLKQAQVDVSQLSPQYPGDDHLPILGALIQGHSKGIEEAAKQAGISKDQATAAKDQADATKTQAEADYYKSLGLAPGVSPDVAQFAAFVKKGGKPENYAGYKAQQEASATQPYKLQLSQAEAKAKQLIEGTAQPVYAYDPQTNSTSLMSKTDALQSGLKSITPVTEKEVRDDTMLINRLADVRQKIARYEQSLQQPISSSDKGNMAGLLDSQKLRIGAFGTEFPAARFDAVLNAENVKTLSPAARDQIVAYRNAREALVGYNRVLSGSGKSSDKALELQEQTLPDPAISDRDFAQRSIGQFKENLRIVGQGLPKIPGIKSPEEWEQDVTNPGGGFPKPPMVPLSLLFGAKAQ